jgi:hypothetical protein
MALQVEVGADISELKDKLAEAQLALEKLRKQKATDIKLGLDVSNLQKQINEAKANISGLSKEVNRSASAMDNHSKATANGGNTLMQFSRIAQDAPFGIMGIGNNLTATAESFAHLSKTSGGAGNALKAVASSIMGTGGILLAVSLVTSALTYMSQKGITVSDVFKKLTGDFDEYAAALKAATDAAYTDDSVISAVSNVESLRNELQLAKDGFIDKEKVVKHYNETMGKTAGVVSNLDEVEKQLVKNGDAYVKMMLYKAAANFALEEAAKSALKAEQTRVKDLKEFTSVVLDADLTQTRSKEQYEAKQKNLERQRKKRQQDEIKLNQDAANTQLDIANNFQKKAAEISKKGGFNFFDDNKVAKEPKVKKDTFAIEKELQDKLKAMNALAFSDKIALIDSYSKIEISKRQKLKDDILKQEKEYNKSVLDGQNRLAAASALAKGEEMRNLKQIQLDGLTQAAKEIEAHEKFLENVGKTEGQKRLEQDQSSYSARLAELNKFLDQKIITQQQYDALVYEAAKNTNATLRQFDSDANALITGSISDTFGQLGTAIGTALATGGNVLNSMGSALLQGLGKFISEMGSMLIQYGTMTMIKGKLDLAIKKGGKFAIAAGIGAIAVGVAAKAIGGAISAKANAGIGGGAESGVGTGQRGSISSGADISSPTSSVSSGGTFNNSGGTVVFEIAGQKLIGVLNNTTQGNLRLGGSGLVG